MVSILLVTNNIYAFDCSNADQKTTFCGAQSGNLPYSAFVTISNSGEKLNMWWTKDGNTYMAGDVAYFSIKLNGKPAMCLDGNKSYSYGAQYVPVYKITDQFVIKLFSWAQESPANAKTAQIIFWNLASSDCKSIKPNGKCINGNGQQMDYFFYKIESISQFVDRFKNALVAAGETSYSLPAKWALPDYRMCDCIGTKSKTKTGQRSCKDSFDIEYKDDCDSKYCSSTLNIDGVSYSYDKSDLNSDLIATCKQIANTKDTDKKVEIWMEYYAKRWGGTDNPGYWIISGQTESRREADVRNIYSEIITTPIKYSALEVYVPYSDGTIDSGVQRIIAPVPDAIVPNNCSNFLGNLKKLGYSSSDLDQLENFLHIELVDKEDTQKVRCASKVKDCNEQVKTYLFIKKLPNPNFTPKLNNRWIFIYDIQTTPSGLSCKGCATEYTKFISEYGGSCDTFKKKIEDPENIKECIEGVKVTCIPTGGGDTCESLITNSKYQGQVSEAVWKEFYNKISDKEKASYVGGKIYCTPPCEPDVNFDNGVCASKTQGKAWFELSDAKDGGDPNKACYQGDTAYNIDSDIVASKNTNMSNTYCDTYCWESLTTSLPYEPGSVSEPILAGQLFFWGVDYSTHTFATMDTKRTCWTVPKYDLFNTHWYANEDALALAYATYLAKKEYNENTTATVSEDGECCISGYHEGSSSTETNVPCDLSDPGTQSRCTKTGQVWNTIANAYTDVCTCTNTTAPSCDNKGHYYKKEGEVEKSVVSSSGKTQTAKSGTARSECTSSAPSAASLTVDNPTTDLNTYVNKRSDLQAAINMCQSESGIVGTTDDRKYNNNIYKYTATMTIQSTDQLNSKGVKNYGLVRTIDHEEVEVTPQNGQKLTYSCTTNIGEYNKHCDANNQVVIDYYPEFYWNYKGSISFKYNDDFFFYALKENAHITNKYTLPADIGGDDELKYEQYELGWGIPTGFNVGTGFFKMGVTMSGFGNDKHFDLIEEKGETKYGYSIKEYECGYFIENKLYETPPCNYSCNQETKTCTKILDSPAQCCDNPPCPKVEGGINVVYRLIDMAEGNTKKIFPSIDGDGRTPGYNWSSYINAKATAYKNITTTSVIYDKTPMYTIELTPTNIGKIRKDNTELRKKDKDPYTSYRDVNNKLKIKCDTKQDEMKSCVSKYVTTLMGGNYNVITGGTFKVTNESQRLKMLSNYKTCYDNSNPNC